MSLKSNPKFKRPIYLLIGALLIGAFLFFNKQKLQVDLAEKPAAIAPVGAGDAVIPEQHISEPVKPEALSAAKLQAATVVDIASLSLLEKKSWKTFQEILLSKNDNDPRLDSDLKNLSPALHQALLAKYSSLPMESRSERGLIVFLVARDLQSPDDLKFLKSIYDESPCLSLANCGTRTESDPHISGIDDTSANYPQLTALFQLDQLLTTKPGILMDPNMKDHFRAVIEQALKFPVPAIQQKAAEIQAKIP